MYGFGADFHWKDLTLSFLFKGSAKVDYYRSGLGNDAGWIPFYNGELGNVIKLANNPQEQMDARMVFRHHRYGKSPCRIPTSLLWRQYETTPSFPLSGNGTVLSCAFRNSVLKYNLKTPWIKKTGLSSGRSGVCCQQPFYYRQSEYFDPEQASANGAAYPIPATYTFQVYLKF